MLEREPLPFAASDLERTFSSATIERGRAYADGGRVERLRVEHGGARIVASVRGGRPRAYDVTAVAARRANRVSLSGWCSCPVGVDCKHVAAALLAALDGLHAVERDDGEAAADATEHWLFRFGTLAALGAPAPRNSSVTFVFKRSAAAAAQRSLPIEAFATDEGARLRPVSLAVVASGSVDGSVAEDVAIARLVAAAATAKGDLAGVAGEAIERAVGSGRALLDAPDGRPLTLGGAREATVAWRVDARGDQALAIEVAGVELLTTRPVVWYVDPATGEAGPATRPGIGDALLGGLLGLGPVAPAGASRVAATLARHGLPVPAVLLEERTAVSPVPVLVLSTRTSPELALVADEARVPGRGEIDEARVAFEYANVRVEAGDPSPDVRSVAGGVATVVPRDAASERRALRRLADFGLMPLTSRRTPEIVRYALPPPGDPRASVFLHRYLPKLRAEGWRVELDATFGRRVVDVVADDAWRTIADERGDGWFDLAIDLVVDGRRVPLLPLLARVAFGDEPALRAELEHAVTGDVVYVDLPGESTAVAFPADRLRAIVETLVELRDGDRAAPAERLAIPAERLGIVAELARDGGPPPSLVARARSTVDALARIDAAPALDPPAGFRATLRGYQREGLGRLDAWRQLGTGGVLADDMGLGKTLQALAHVAVERAAGRLTGPVLVVVPTSLVATWLDEATRFAPSMRVVAYHGARRDERVADDADVVVTTYALLARGALAGRTWPLVVFDEAQALKNPAAAVSKAARAVRAERRLCLTGTPVENDLGELWSILDLAVPNLLGDRKRFGALFRVPIEKRGDATRRAALAARIRPYVLRRTKERVAADLPPKTEIVRRIELDGAQRDVYETVRAAMQARVRDGIARDGLARSGITVLDALLTLRQACCDPRLLPARLRGAPGAGDAPSAKLAELGAMLAQLVAEGHRALVFSQFTSMLALIEAELAARGLATLSLTGATRDRAGVVARFQAGDAPVFLASLKAGGVGLTLTAADTVIHYDPWWNPAAERQATDRVHRIGQTVPVFAYKLVAAGTVEEKILELQARKAELAEALLDGSDGGGAALANVLDAETVDRLFAP